jgi:transcriptional regulator with XRE-family HTH domain
MRDEDHFDAMIAGLVDIGFSRTEIAEGAGFSRQTLYRLEHGQARPLHDTVQRLKSFAETRGVTRTVHFRG